MHAIETQKLKDFFLVVGIAALIFLGDFAMRALASP